MIIRYSSSALSFYQAGENQALVFMGGDRRKINGVYNLKKKWGIFLEVWEIMCNFASGL